MHPRPSQGDENDSSAAPTTSPYTLENHSYALSTLAKNFWGKDKYKGKRNVRDYSLSSYFSLVKKSKI